MNVHITVVPPNAPRRFAALLPMAVMAVALFTFQALAQPESPEPWTTQDVIDSRIDVSAQYGLMRMLSGGPEERVVGSHILSSVKNGTLGGIYQEDQQVPALRAQASGYGWWQILPRSDAGVKLDSKCMTDPASRAPIIVMRKKAETNPVAYDQAMQVAWYSCGLPAAPVRPYEKTLPNKQSTEVPGAANKGPDYIKCAGPDDKAGLMAKCEEHYTQNLAVCAKNRAEGKPTLISGVEVWGEQECAQEVANKRQQCLKDIDKTCPE